MVSLTKQEPLKEPSYTTATRRPQPLHQQPRSHAWLQEPFRRKPNKHISTPHLFEATITLHNVSQVLPITRAKDKDQRKKKIWENRQTPVLGKTPAASIRDFRASARGSTSPHTSSTFLSPLVIPNFDFAWRCLGKKDFEKKKIFFWKPVSDSVFRAICKSSGEDLPQTLY